MNDFIQTVAKMREYQKQHTEAIHKKMYVAAGSILKSKKDYESRVDRMIQEMQGDVPVTQKELF
jgi:hypothetical protein